MDCIKLNSGGSCEIRTHGGLSSSPVFKTGAFNRSAKLPLRADYTYIWATSRPESKKKWPSTGSTKSPHLMSPPHKHPCISLHRSRRTHFLLISKTNLLKKSVANHLKTAVQAQWGGLVGDPGAITPVVRPLTRLFQC